MIGEFGNLGTNNNKAQTINTNICNHLKKGLAQIQYQWNGKYAESSPVAHGRKIIILIHATLNKYAFLTYCQNTTLKYHSRHSVFNVKSFQRIFANSREVF